MSKIVMTAELDTKQAEADAAKIEQRSAEITRTTESNISKLTVYYSYAAQMSSLLLSQVSQTFKGQEIAAEFQQTQTLLSIASSEFSIAMTMYRGYSEIGQGNIAAGLAQMTIASMMQAVLFQQQNLLLKQEQASNQAQLDALYWSQYT